MRYDNDGVRVGLLGLKSRRIISHHLHYLEHWRRRRRPCLLGYDPNEKKDGVAGQRRTTTSSSSTNTGGQTTTGSLKVLLYGYVHELAWFCTRLNEFLFLFVFQLLYER